MHSLKFTTMAKYSKEASKKVETEMHEMHEGKLKSGSGKKVTDPKQAIAIGLSEARKEGKKVPPAPGKKSTTKKAATKKSTATKKTAGKKATEKKAATPKKAVKKVAPRKSAAK